MGHVPLNCLESLILPWPASPRSLGSAIKAMEQAFTSPASYGPRSAANSAAGLGALPSGWRALRLAHHLDRIL